MSLSRISTALFAAGLMLALPRTGQAQDPGDSVLATVNGTAISLSDLEALRAGMPAQYQQLPFAMLQNHLLDRAINDELLMQAGEALKLDESAEVVQRLQLIKRRLVAEIYLDRFLSARINDEIISAAYDDYITANAPENKVSARHILVKTEAEARDVITALNGGADFAELAKERSIGPSGPKGGDLGTFGRTEMVPPFAEAAFSMSPGAFSSTPVQTRFGWHVILVENVIEGTHPGLEDIRGELEGEVSRRLVAQHYDDLAEKAEIVKPEQDPAQ